jgi:hypothetical protein
VTVFTADHNFSEHSFVPILIPVNFFNHVTSKTTLLQSKVPYNVTTTFVGMHLEGIEVRDAYCQVHEFRKCF